MSTSRIEQETVLTFNEAEKTAIIWSASPMFQRRMERLGVEPIDCSERENGKSCAYRVPKSWIKVRKPRQLSEEQRQQAAARLRAMQTKK